MASENMKLPIIDFCDLKKDTPKWETVKDQVREAMEEYGCFEALFDKIPESLQKSTYDGLEQLFDLPVENKKQNKSGKFSSGYQKYPSGPLFESLSIDYSGEAESFVNLMWPEEGNPPFRKSLESYLGQLAELDEVARRVILESLGLEKYMDEHLESKEYVVAFIKYTGPAQTEEAKTGLATHTDTNIITILSENDVNGLEVLTKDGKNWILAQPSPSSFIILAGESLHAWSNGRVHCPLHRVMMTGSDDRYSIGQFSIFKKGYTIKAPEEMVDEEHPLLYKPFDYYEFRQYYKSPEAVKKPLSAIKAYCGA